MSYQLVLPSTWGIHDVFHASLLLPYVETATHGPNFMPPPPDLIEGEEHHEVEQIMGHCYHRRNKRLQYLIRWKGQSSADDTWEPVEHLATPDLLQCYHRCIPLSAYKNPNSHRQKISIRTTQSCPKPPLLPPSMHPNLLHSPPLPSMFLSTTSPTRPTKKTSCLDSSPLAPPPLSWDSTPICQVIICARSRRASYLRAMSDAGLTRPNSTTLKASSYLLSEPSWTLTRPRTCWKCHRYGSSSSL
jgi:hypothetical protein